MDTNVVTNRKRSRPVEGEADGDDQDHDGQVVPVAVAAASVQDHPCFSLLQANELANFSLSHTPESGYRLVAAKNLPADSLLFSLPMTCLLTYESVCATALSREICRACGCGASSIAVSPEALFWLNMVHWWQDTPQNKTIYAAYHNYLRSLSKIPPNASSWPQELQDELKNTNVYQRLQSQNDGQEEDDVSCVMTCLEEIRKRLQTFTAATATDTRRATQTLLTEPSIFTKTSLSWARGHFLSRRFRNPLTLEDATATQQQQQELDSTTPADSTPAAALTSALIPVLDLMNHCATKDRSCTLQLRLHHDDNDNGGDNQKVLQVWTGSHAVTAGDELFTCYGESLSNESLLRSYGFCLANNPSDTVSLKIQRDNNNNNHNNDTAASSKIFSVGRGGVSAISPEVWKAIAGTTGSSTGDAHDNSNNDSTDAVEIGSGDLERFLRYTKSELRRLETPPTTAEPPSTDTKPNDMNKTNSQLMNRERLRFVEMYKSGQREILGELIRDLTYMVGQATTSTAG